MGTDFWWIFDALMIIILAAIVYSNARRGITKVLVMGIGYVLATMAAVFVSAPASEVIYEKVAMDSDIAAFQRVNRKVRLVEMLSGVIDKQHLGFVADRTSVREILAGERNAEFVQQLYDYVNREYGEKAMTEETFETLIKSALIQYYGGLLGEELPEYVRLNFEQKFTEDNRLMPELITKLFAPAPERYLEETYAQKPTQQVLQIFVYLILFSIVMVITAIISASLENKLFLNTTYSSERIFGGVIGLVEAISVIIMLTMLVRLVVMLGGGDLLCFNDATIERTKLFRYIYNFMGA